ncbi:hypothetical protein F5884DRAFT_687754 [Xylogone sp. PMI_703]|nr:hypothetical protein F5884DRAFT_687754 [Xylogone sp. PMI_703]
MPQQRHVRCTDDDWTGVTSAAQRRKLQNRLNQRAYRQCLALTLRQRRSMETERRKPAAAYQKLLTASGGTSHAGTSKAEKDQVCNELTTFLITQHGYKMLQSPQDQAKMLGIARDAYASYTLGIARPAQLHLLIKLNVLNAFTRNAEFLGLPPSYICSDGAASIFPREGPQPITIPSWPKHLQPSPVQRSVQHSAWLDLIPFPLTRDKILLAINAGLLDEDELCQDLLEVDDNGSDAPYLIVWGDSSDPRGWEASFLFLEKYRWLVWDCSEIIESTNFWRSMRGEKQLGSKKC